VAELAQRVEQALRKGEGTQIPPLVARARPEALPLSFAQQRLWFLDQLEPGNPAYLIPGALRMDGKINVQALECSFQELIDRHESLRTTFEEQANQPMQVIHPAGPYYTLPVIDLRGLETEQRERVARLLASQERQHPCDLTTGPLLRTALLRLGSQEHVLLLTLHHIISDGWSNGVLVRELTTLYQAFVSGEPSPLAPLSLQYADYALWQREWLQGEMLQQHLEYWKKQLWRAKPLALPTDTPHTARQSHRGTRYPFHLPAKLSKELVTLSRQEDVTLFMLLLAAFQVLLYRWTGQTDIVVGTDVASRTHVQTEELIGFFVNLLALRTEVQGASNFRKIVQQVRAMVLEAYAHQELPFDVVVEHLQLERKDKQTPLVQVLFVLQNAPKSTEGLSGITFESIQEESPSVKFDLAFFLNEGPQGIGGSVLYRAGLFKEQTIATLVQRFEVMLRNVVLMPETPIDELEISTDEEKIEQMSYDENMRRTNIKRLRSIKSEAINLSVFPSSLRKPEKDQ
jgi:NRPS condensation-like uncharacterized protein